MEAAIRSLLLDTYQTETLPIHVTKPWGYELIFGATDKYTGKLLHVKKGQQLSLQYHNRKEEHNLLFRGRLALIKGPNVLGSKPYSLHDIEAQLSETVLEAGSTWHNQPGEVHTIRALEDSDIFEVSTSDLDDVVRLKDNYKREGTSKP